MLNYVDNGKISNRQMYRLFVFDLMGIATLLIPPYLAKLCGIDGIFVISTGIILAFTYLFYLGWVMKHMGMDINTYLEHKSITVVKSIVWIFVLMHCILTAGFCGYVFAKVMQYSLAQEIAFPILLFVIIVGAGYAVTGGIESRARVYEVLFWFVLVPYVVMILASVKNFELQYMSGFLEVSRGNFLEGTYLVFLFFTPLFFSLFLIGEKEKSYGKNAIKIISLSLLVSGGILLGSYILLIGNFGSKSLATMEYPVITLMSTIQFKGNFLKRMDAFMVAVWFFTLYALLNLHVHYGTSMMRVIFSKGKKRGWQVIMLSVFVYAVGYSMYRNQDLVWIFVNYYSYFVVPIIVIGPGLLLLCKKKGGVKSETKA